MRHVRDMIRLKSAGMATREIARRVGTAPSTVRVTIRRFEASGLTWLLSDDITDTELEARRFASAGAGSGTRRDHRRQAEPDWAAVHRQLKRKYVTLSILWEEYITGEPGGYRYSRFCELYRAWEGRLSVTMRQSHAAGDKPFVDSSASPRISGNHKHTTVPEHMASSHRRYAGWTIERIRKDAASIGPATAALCELILDERSHPEQGFCACLGIIRLARSYGQERLDAAAMRAIDIGARTYSSVKSILANNLDRRPSPKRSADDAPILHLNTRGPRYYNALHLARLSRFWLQTQ